MSNSHLKITGQVTVGPCPWIDPYFCWTILIMGPTGAGKSAFIEALAGPGHTLGISKDQLAGCTQDVLCYQVQNALLKRSNGDTQGVCLIDTPGFSDSKISEMEIINKVKAWMKVVQLACIDTILYLTPITDTRVPGSKRRTIKMLKLLMIDHSARRVSIVTTMWDQVSNAQAKKRAEAHFAQLRDDIWKGLVDNGAQVVRFQNNHKSAIDVVRVSVIHVTSADPPLWGGPISGADRSAPLLYQELLDRISNTRQEIEVLRVDHIQLISDPDPLLESAVIPLLQEAKLILAKFLGQLVEFGKPPRGFEGVPEQVVYQSLLNSINEAKEDKQALEMALSYLNMDSHAEREPILRARLLEAEENLARYSEMVLEYETYPQWYEKASQVILAAVPPLPPPPPPPPVRRLRPLTPPPRHSLPAAFTQVKKRIKGVKDKLTLRLRRGPHH